MSENILAFSAILRLCHFIPYLSYSVGGFIAKKSCNSSWAGGWQQQKKQPQAAATAAYASVDVRGSF